MKIKIISTCIISLFILLNNYNELLSENVSSEMTKIQASPQEELIKNNVELSYTSNDLDCN